MGRSEDKGEERTQDKAFCPGCGMGLTEYYGGVASYFRKQAERERKMREKVEQRCDPAGDTQALEMCRENLTAALAEIEEYKQMVIQLTIGADKAQLENVALKNAARDTGALLRRNEQLQQDCTMKDERIDWTVNDCANKAIRIADLQKRLVELRKIVDSQNES